MPIAAPKAAVTCDPIQHSATASAPRTSEPGTDAPEPAGRPFQRDSVSHDVLRVFRGPRVGQFDVIVVRVNRDRRGVSTDRSVTGVNAHGCYT